ncbi:DUF190 domain-containing protein [Spirochaetia bacterium 38H-sp]|uniref:DUF190 domain-containing protein n=1 Tax=Rarispira pelagica TaxID=3141764 RepID=A0ABU9UBN4_9SPIR
MKKMTKLTIYTTEESRYHNTSLVHAITEESRKNKLAGCTVYKGSLGYGQHRHMHDINILALSENLPVIIDIIDTREKIDTILPFIQDNLKNGIYTLTQVEAFIPENK